jgi:hypothetical protein
LLAAPGLVQALEREPELEPVLVLARVLVPELEQEPVLAPVLARTR